MKNNAPVNTASAGSAVKKTTMHPRRLARQIARNVFARNGWNMGYFPLQWRGAVKMVVPERGSKRGR